MEVDRAGSLGEGGGWYKPRCRGRNVLESSEGDWSSLGGWEKGPEGTVLVDPH